MTGPVINIIDKVICRMKEEMGSRSDDIEIYVGMEIWRTIEVEVGGPLKRVSNRAISDADSQGASPFIEGGVTDEPTYEEYPISLLNGSKLIQEPRIGDYEIIIVDRKAISQKSTGEPILVRPAGLYRLQLGYLDGAEPCSHCGERTTVEVEGDDGEGYCSINCLNNAYVK